MITANGKKNYRWYGVCALLLALLIWEIAAAVIVANTFILPSPPDVLFALSVLSKRQAAPGF